MIRSNLALVVQTAFIVGILFTCCRMYPTKRIALNRPGIAACIDLVCCSSCFAPAAWWLRGRTMHEKHEPGERRATYAQDPISRMDKHCLVFSSTWETGGICEALWQNFRLEYQGECLGRHIEVSCFSKHAYSLTLTFIVVFLADSINLGRRSQSP